MADGEQELKRERGDVKDTSPRSNRSEEAAGYPELREPAGEDEKERERE